MAKSCSKWPAAPSNENAHHLCQWLLGSKHWNGLTGILEEVTLVARSRVSCRTPCSLQVVGGSAVQAAVQLAPECDFV